MAAKNLENVNLVRRGGTESTGGGVRGAAQVDIVSAPATHLNASGLKFEGFSNKMKTRQGRQALGSTHIPQTVVEGRRAIVSIRLKF